LPYKDSICRCLVGIAGQTPVYAVSKGQLAAVAQKVQQLGILQGAQMCVIVAAAEYHRQGFLARAISVKSP